MKNSVAIIYLFWFLLLTALGAWAFKKIADVNDPSSVSHNFKKLKETLDEYP